MDSHELYAACLAESVPHICALCGIPSDHTDHYRDLPGLELAHIFSKGAFGPAANIPQNCVFLCNTCHRANHNGPTHNDATGQEWPDVSRELLLSVKTPLDSEALSKMTGYVPTYFTSMAQIPMPDALVLEREKWGLTTPRTMPTMNDDA